MKTRTARRTLGGSSLPLMLVLAAGILLAGCASEDGRARKPTTAATQASDAAPATAPAARSPRELALGDFLKAMTLEGKPVLIEFGLVGCELSEKGLTRMAALQQAKAIPGLAFVRVEGNQDAAAVDAYFKSRNLPFPVHRDKDAVLAKALGATAFPTFLLADKFGHIRYTGKYPVELAAWGNALAAETQDPGSQPPPFGAKAIDVQKLLAAKLPNLAREQTPLSDGMGDGGMVLLFVDTVCPFSATALKEMPAVSKVLAERKIGAVVINSDDNAEKVTDFYAVNDPGVPVLYDTGAATREQWNVQSVPIAVYVTPAGKIAYQGEAVWADLGTAIETSAGLAAGTIKFTSAGTSFG